MSDAVFFGAHPDDVEILAGGTVARLVSQGRRVLIADATRGEMASRGTPEERAREAANAARVLGVERINLDLPDGRISEDVPEATRRVVETLRTHRPRIVFVHEPGDHHPDHNALSQAVKFACFQSNVLNYETGQERFRPDALFYYVGSRQRWPEEPSFVVDITDFWEKKLESLRAHVSQLVPGYRGPETYISSDIAWHLIEMRAGFFGGLINTRYGEGFRSNAPLRLDDPFILA